MHYLQAIHEKEKASKETYKVLEQLSKVILPDAKLSVAKTIEAIANEKAKKLNGKLKKN